MIYLEQAVQRIENIKWELFGKIEFDEQTLCIEYLKRIAKFLKSQSIKPINPNPFTNIADLLGYQKKFDISEYCNKTVVHSLKNSSIPRHILECYLQLSAYADIDLNMAKYLAVYEPLIQLIEKGGNFSYRERGLIVYNSTVSSLYPLNAWYDRYINLC